MRGRELFRGRFVLSFLLATGIFLMVFSFSYAVSYFNYQALSNQANSLELSIAELDKILSNFECDSSLLVESSESFDNAANDLSLLEKRFGKHDYRVLEQKKLYSELQYRHFLITQRFNQECKTSFFTVLFFYSNNDSRLEDLSERTGYILTAFERENASRIMIYSFDSDLDSSVVKFLKEKYAIDSVPIVVVNNSSKIWPKSLSDIDRYLN